MANMQQQNSGGIFTMTTGVTGVKGAYFTAIGSTLFDAKWLWLGIGSLLGGQFDEIIEMDIATGLAGFEVDDYPDCFWWNSGRATQNLQNFFLPINIPAGSRISLRAKTNLAAAPSTFHVTGMTITDIPMPKGDPVSSIVLPRTIISTPASAGTDGPIVEVISSLPTKLDYMIIHYQSATTNISSQQNWDLMTGAAGFEFDRMGEMPGDRNRTPTKQEQSVPWCGPVAFDAGERLSLRAKTNVNSAQILSWQAIGYEYPVQ